MMPQEVDAQAIRPLHLQAEQRVALCACWLVPACMIVCLPVMRGCAYYLVTLRTPECLWRWGDVLRPSLVLGAACVCALPFVWLAGVRAEMRRADRPRVAFAFAAVSAVVTATIAAVLFASAWPRWLFLEAVKVRSEPFSFARSLAFWQRDAQEWQPASGRVSTFLVGSSQMNFAVDAEMLSRQLPQVRVQKRCLPGFGVMQYAMVAPELLDRRADIVVCWLSEFDTFRDDRVPANRLRAFARWPQVWRLSLTLGQRESWRNRVEMSDLALASLMPFWRDRDLLRRLALHFWWRGQDGAQGQPPKWMGGDADRQRANLARSIRRTRLVAANFRAFRSFVRHVTSRGIRVLVFEGATNALYTSAYDPRFRVETRERLQDMAREERFVYVDEGQMPVFGAGDFCDAYHLNRQARRRFTTYLATRLREMLAS